MDNRERQGTKIEEGILELVHDQLCSIDTQIEILTGSKTDIFARAKITKQSYYNFLKRKGITPNNRK